MGTILSSAVVNETELMLNDEGNDEFDADDLFTCLKTAQRIISLIKPDVSVTNAAVVCVAGVKQSLPAGGTHLNHILRNMGTAGTTLGAVIPLVERDELDAIKPGWATETASATVKAYMYDPKDPKVFYVYPAQPSSAFGYVQMSYAVTPADPATIAAAITLDDVYALVLIQLMLWMAHSVDAASSPYASQRSKEHWNTAVTLLGRKDLKEQIDKPRVKKDVNQD